MIACRCQLVLSGLCVLFVGMSAAAADLPYKQHENIVYLDSSAYGVGLVMDVFTPTGSGNGLGIVDVASGAWNSGRGKINDHKKAQVYDIFCKRGYTVFSVRPGSINRFNGHDMLANLKAGIVWVKQHSAEYKIDPARLGLTGGSAGGHLASLAAVRPDDAKKDQPDSRVKAVAVFFPPADFMTYGKRGFDPKSPITLRLGGARDGKVLTDEQLKDSLIKLSPALQVTKDAPPFLIIHGDADKRVPLQQSQTLLEALEKANVPAELIIKKGGGHAWLTIHEEVEVMAKWFDSHLAATKTAAAASPATAAAAATHPATGK